MGIKLATGWRLDSRAELAGFRVIRLRRVGYLSGPPPARHLTVGDHARHAGIATLSGAGHLMPLQNPGAVGKLIADFARRHASRPEPHPTRPEPPSDPNHHPT